MPFYKVHFKWKGKELCLKAKSLDLTHPYFVSIKDLVFSGSKKIIIDPSEDDVKRMFGRSEHIMLPFQTVLLIEEYKKDPDMVASIVKAFPTADLDQNEDQDQPLQ